GKVPSSDVRDLAGQIAAGTSGVRDVKNLLVVDPAVDTDQDRARLSARIGELERQIAIADAIQQGAFRDGAKVRVRVAGPIVTLEGNVGREGQRARAEEIVRRVANGAAISNQLR